MRNRLEVPKFQQTSTLIRSVHSHVLYNYRLPHCVCFTSFWALLLITHRQGTPTLQPCMSAKRTRWLLVFMSDTHAPTLSTACFESRTWQFKQPSWRRDILVIFGPRKLWTKLLRSNHHNWVLEGSGGCISDVNLPGTLSSGVLWSISVHK